MRHDFLNLKVGDTVTRIMGGIPMQLLVTNITEERIVCGPWEFSKETGGEIDEELGWDATQSGSYLDTFIPRVNLN